MQPTLGLPAKVLICLVACTLPAQAVLSADCTCVRSVVVTDAHTSQAVIEKEHCSHACGHCCASTVLEREADHKADYIVMDRQPEEALAEGGFLSVRSTSCPSDCECYLRPTPGLDVAAASKFAVEADTIVVSEPIADDSNATLDCVGLETQSHCPIDFCAALCRLLI
ncbi:MAG: hypothetical protein SGJ20_04905 [Planctomycetota bacterium]|nr:hypothetical protein [Planctomycetota bacterium]